MRSKFGAIFYRSGHCMTVRHQKLMSVRMQSDVRVELFLVVCNEIINCSGFWFRERFWPSISVATRCPGSTFVACFIFDQPVIRKVSVWIDTITDQRNRRSGLAPVSIVVACVFITIRVCDWQNVPINILSHKLNFRINRTQQMVQNIS